MTKQNRPANKVQKKRNTLRAISPKQVRHPKKTAIERAIEFGVDITLLEQNLKMTPTQRMDNFQRWLEFAEHVRRAGEVKRNKYHA